MGTTRCAVVIGHNRINRGAQGIGPDGDPWYHEWDFLTLIGSMVVSRLHGSRLFLHAPRNYRGDPERVPGRVSYHGTYAATLSDVNAFKASIAVELHFNSVPRMFDTSQGQRKARDWDKALALVWPGSDAKSWAPALVEACSVMPGVKAGGVYEKKRSWADAPLLFLRDPAATATDMKEAPIVPQLMMPSCILEVCNGKNPQHVVSLRDNADALADALVVALGSI